MSYVKCIDNEGYEASLHKSKVYRQVFNEPSIMSALVHQWLEERLDLAEASL